MPAKPAPEYACEMTASQSADDFEEKALRRAQAAAELAIQEAERAHARLRDTLRIGVARGDYPESAGREEEWMAERLAKLENPQGRHEQTLSDGRCILIEGRRTTDGGTIGLRVDITEMKQREASFRLLFDSNPVPMLVYALDDQHIIAVNDAAIAHYGYCRDAFLRMALGALHDPGEPAALPHLAALRPTIRPAAPGNTARPTARRSMLPLLAASHL